ncbi:MAG: LysR family transcriptional regulator [Pseudomonadota bacterium]
MLSTAHRYVLSVAETGSIRASSQALNVAASAISRQIQQVEHQFGHPLFERFASGMVLTPEGRILERHLRRTAREIEMAQAEIDDLHGLVTGTIRFAAIEGVLASWLIPAMADFRDRHPGIQFDARILGSQAAYDMLMAERLDFGVVVLDETWPGIDILKRDDTPLLAAMRPDHPLCGQEVLPLGDIARAPLTMLDRSFATRLVFDRILAKGGLQPTIALEVNHIETAKRHVLATGGVTILPEYAVSAEVEAGTFAARPLAEAPPLFDTALITRQNTVRTKAADRFLEEIAAVTAIP